jgi:pumilio RNA-binding family
MLPYAAIPVDFSGHPMLLPQPQGFSQLGCFGPWASECRGASPARRRRPRRGKGGACFGAIAANECHEVRKSKAKVGVGASVSLPAANAVSDILDSDPSSVSEDADLSMKILNLLESKDKVKKSSILGWISPATLELALSAHGCRIVQKAFDVACGDEKRELAIKLHGHVKDLLESQHGNHVLQKCIEVLPPQAVQFIIDELAFWPMSWAGVAKHRFGCRVIERLLEHCPEDMTVPLTDAVVSDASALARHPYGNYVVQHVLEYGTDVHRNLLVSVLVDTGIAFLAQHRIASNVIESALGRVCSADQQTIGLALLAAPQTLLVVGCSRYGTHVVNRLLEVLAPGPLRVQVVRQLLDNLPQIMESKHSKHLVEKLVHEWTGVTE